MIGVMIIDPVSVPDGKLFVAAAPLLKESEVMRAFEALYGFCGKATRLHSERDVNYLIDSEQGRYILKITNQAEPSERTSVNTDVLRYLNSTAPDLPIPSLVVSKRGDYQSFVDFGDGGKTAVRLFEYLDGIPLEKAHQNERLYRRLGSVLGRIASILATYKHADMYYPLLWDSSNVHRLTDLVPCLPIPDSQSIIGDCLRCFEREVMPRLADLPYQMIHNDANLNNVLVCRHTQGEIVGLFDFGDMVYAPAINEIAVAASYLVRGREDLMPGLAALLKGYKRYYPCDFTSIRLLPDLIMARHLTTILVTNWRASLFPENAKYILRNNAGAWRGLAVIRDFDRTTLNNMMEDIMHEVG